MAPSSANSPNNFFRANTGVRDTDKATKRETRVLNEMEVIGGRCEARERKE